MRDRKTGRIIWYLFSAVLIKWGVEIAVATFALSCGLRSNMGIGAVSSIITIPMIAWIYRKDQGRYEKQQESWWKYKAASGYGMWFVMLLGAVTACVAMNDIVMLMNMQRISQVYQSTEQIIYSAPRWLQLAGAGILAPVAEELVYRGMIYRRMRESLTAVQAGVFVSILFGVGHGNLPQGLYAMVLGLLLACIYEKFRNIAAPILFHIVVNITSLLLSWYGGFEWILGTEGKAGGIEEDIAALLGNWDGISVTYAGGVSSFEDLRKLKELGRNKVDVTIGSALDLFGGEMPFSKVLEEINF